MSSKYRYDNAPRSAKKWNSIEVLTVLLGLLAIVPIVLACFGYNLYAFLTPN